MTKKSTSGITVVGVEAKDFHRLRFAKAELRAGGGLVRVTGKNGAGKSSLLRAIRAALGGAAEVLPEVINEESEDGKGSVRLELSNRFRVTRRFTAANPKGHLTVEGPDGGKYPQAKLSEWLGPLSFDPLAFFDLPSARQGEILLSIGTDPDLPAKLEELRKERAAKYEERTPWISQKRRVAGIAKPAGEKPTPVDVSAELRRMGELQRVERQREEAIRATAQARLDARRGAEERLRQAGSDVEAAQSFLDDAVEAVEAADREVARLEEELAKARRAAELARETHALMEQDLASKVIAADAIEDPDTIAARIPEPEIPSDPSEEIAAIRTRIEAADEVRASIEPWSAWERAQAELAEATAAEKSLTSQMDAIALQERKLIAAAGISVPGLSFADDGSPLLNERPLLVASGAERCRLAVAVAMAANPDLRICLLDEEANGLDLDGLKQLDELAREHGFQVWAARIGLEGGGEVVVEDGIAKTPLQAADAEAAR